jgi:hypothetical protein
MIIELEDRILIDAEVTNYQVSGPSEQVQKAIDSVRPLLLKVVQPVLSAWNDLAKSATVEKAEIELAFGIEASGNFFVASTKGSSNLKVKVTVVRTPVT